MALLIMYFLGVMREALVETQNASNEDSKLSPLNTKNKFSMMRRTNFSQSEADDPNQRYTNTEELEAVQNPDKEFKKYFDLISFTIFTFVFIKLLLIHCLFYLIF